MHNRIFRQNSGKSKSSSTPVPNPFQSRPFAPTPEVSPQPQETQDLEQLKQNTLQSKSSGYNFANVNVTPRETYSLPRLQRKLTIGESNDGYEQEADRVARQVVDKINTPVPETMPDTGRGEKQQLYARDRETKESFQAKPESPVLLRDSSAGEIQRDFWKTEDKQLKRQDIKQVVSDLWEAQLPNMPKGMRTLTPEQKITLIKKLGEGRDIEYANPQDLLLQVQTRTKFIGPNILNKQMSGTWRKLNRIAGLMQKRGEELKAASESQELGNNLDQLSQQLTQALGANFNLETENLLKAAQQLLAQAVDAVNEEETEKWLIYRAVSLVAPMGGTLTRIKEKEALSPLHLANMNILREIRRVTYSRAEPMVVAHRGRGPTNRTMGGLIKETDDRRKNRPAENSPEAFESAMESVDQGALDGVECDVFLSEDGQAVLSHESKVYEQVNSLRRPSQPKRGSKATNTKTDVGQFRAAELQKIQRTDKPNSRFMTLEELLMQLADTAGDLYTKTKKPLRVEIEMKGLRHPRQGKTEREDNQNLINAVAKVLSHWEKGRLQKYAPMEFSIFKKFEDAAEIAKTREQKSALGPITVGAEVGPRDNQWKDLEKTASPVIDEVRYQISEHMGSLPQKAEHNIQEKTPLNVIIKLSEKYHITLVFGIEFPHPDVAPKYSNEMPSEGMAWTYGRNLDKERTFKNQVQEGSRRLTERLENNESTATYEEVCWEAVRDFCAAIDGEYRIEVLTDYPENARVLKAGVVTAKEEPKSEEPKND